MWGRGLCMRPLPVIGSGSNPQPLTFYAVVLTTELSRCYRFPTYFLFTFLNITCTISKAGNFWQHTPSEMFSDRLVLKVMAHGSKSTCTPVIVLVTCELHMTIVNGACHNNGNIKIKPFYYWYLFAT